MAKPKIKTMATGCARCGSTQNLVKHHTSYMPEVTETVCKACDAKERRHPEGRGFQILKAYPQRGMLLVRKDILESLGDLLEIETAPANPIGVIFKYGLPLTLVRDSLLVIAENLQLCIEVEARKQQNEQDIK